MIPDEKDEPNMPAEDAYAAPPPEPAPPPTEEDVVDELKKGVGALFRAAKHAVDHLPSAERIESAVKTGVKEVERAASNIPTRKIEGAVKMGVKGMGVAAKEAAKHIPTDKIGDAVKTGAKEVGKAFESVAEAVERTVTRKSVPPKE